MVMTGARPDCEVQANTASRRFPLSSTKRGRRESVPLPVILTIHDTRPLTFTAPFTGTRRFFAAWARYLVVLGRRGVGTEKRGGRSGGSAGLHDLAAADLHGHHGGEGRGRAGEREDGERAAEHGGGGELKNPQQTYDLETT
jgi:hypothetical protein